MHAVSCTYLKYTISYVVTHVYTCEIITSIKIMNTPKVSLCPFVILPACPCPRSQASKWQN